eukprot:TRINITY_DN31318_c0_g1_i1.p1 TRINITY_DN31318_c0_g1~~TRINITY_DN31318_c0_g1_i1.p1  ORF type:complete len:168 (-),score=25.50 TRINITY_DN31318_c0_g1_i1:763-1266(-)
MMQTAGFNGFNGRFDFTFRGHEQKSAAFLQQKREEEERSRRLADVRQQQREAARYFSSPRSRARDNEPTRSPPRELHRIQAPVEFSWPYGGSKVVLAGSFSNWKDRIPLERDSDGVWRTSLRLIPGVYMYKFLVDNDNWCHDMSRESTRDAEGNINNLVRVSVKQAL